MGGNATFLFPKTLKIIIESFANQHDSNIKMAKRRSTISLQRLIDFCFDRSDIDLDSSRGGLSRGAEFEIGKEILKESQ